MEDADKAVSQGTQTVVVRLSAGPDGVVVATGTRRSLEGREGPEVASIGQSPVTSNTSQYNLPVT
jgi:hypothetical protein